jgi:hypothetical protein
MVSIITRAGKGTPLTHDEMDTNLTNIKTEFESDRYAAAVMADQPAAYYRCDEAFGSAVLKDSSGNGFDLTLSGAPSPVRGGLVGSSNGGIYNSPFRTGKFPTALWAKWPLSANFSAETMLFCPSYVALTCLWEAGTTSQSNIHRLGFRVCDGDSGYLQPSFCIGSSTGNNNAFVRTSYLQFGQWYHLVATYDGATLKLYANGKLAASELIAVTVATIVRNGGGGMFMSNWNEMNGNISVDEIAMYNTCLSAGRVALHARLAAGATV